MSVNTQPLQKPQESVEPQMVPRKKIEHYSYILTDLIGQGFSSKVYKGKDERSDDIVAIKVIDMKLITNEVELWLIQQEINALKVMKSPNVLKMYDFYQTSNNTYIITEFCNQGDLGGILKRSGTIPEQEATKIMRHLFNGFKEQIKHEIVHRDLKPQNIFLKNGIPKIADYGFSKLMHIKEKIYYNVGTPYYMSPQTIMQNKYSEKTDLWSLGVLFYEILYGRLPWGGNTEKELAQNMINHQLQFDPKVPISEEAKDFIKKCLIVDEDKRLPVKDIDNHPLFRRRNTTGGIPTKVNQVSGINANIQSDKKSPNRGVTTYTRLDGTGSTSSQQVPNLKDYHTENLKQVNGPGLQRQFQDFQLNHKSIQNKAQSNPANEFGNYLQQQMVTNLIQDQSNLLPSSSQIRQNDDVFKSQLYFVKFISKMQKIADFYNFLQTPGLREKLQFFLIKNCLIKLQRLTDTTQNRVNSLNLEDFENYLHSTNFTKFIHETKDISDQYHTLYSDLWTNVYAKKGMHDIFKQDTQFYQLCDSNFIEDRNFYGILIANLKVVINELNHIIGVKLQFLSEQQVNYELTIQHLKQLPQDLQAGLVLLDYLITYYQLIALTVDQIDDPVEFARISQIKEIADGKPVKLMKYHYYQITNKIIELKLGSK